MTSLVETLPSVEAQKEPPSQIPNHLVPIDLNALQPDQIPESHLWPEPDKSSIAVTHVSIPSIDLKDPNATGLMIDACENWGSFLITNHDFPETLITETQNEAFRIFGLPYEQKLKAVQSPTDITGYSMFVISKNHSKSMWHEGFNIIGSPEDHAKKLWPDDYQRFCDKIEEYKGKMRGLSEHLITSIFKHLEIPEKEIMNFPEPHTALRLNSYPRCPNPSRVMGLAPHTDTSLFTILHQTVGTHGLEVFKEGIGWVSVCPPKGSLIVVVGDILQIVSNDRFRSVIHRVVIKGKEQRLSMAYFYDPPYDWYISPYCKPMSNSPQTPLYRSVMVKDYFSIKGKNMGQGLPCVKISNI